jgi:hypothetical protein
MKSGIEMKCGQCYSTTVDDSTTRRQNSLPVARALYYDFLSYGQDFCWEVTGSSGCIIAVPMATEVALIEPPLWFPKMPEMDSEDTQVREAVEGIHEVANIFESLNPSLSMQKACIKCVRRMEKTFNEVVAAGEIENERVNRNAMIQICENTTYELEALIGAMQIFGNKQLTDVPGTLRVGAFLTFPWYSFEQNYNLNFVMTRWIRAKWCFPYPSHADICKLITMYNFDSYALLSWLENARTLVWQPLSSMDWLERFDLIDPSTRSKLEGDTPTDQSSKTEQVLTPFQLPLRRLVHT